MGRSPLLSGSLARDTAHVRRIGIVAGAGWLAAVGIVVASRLWRRRATRLRPGTAGPAATEIAPDVYLLGPQGRTQTNAYLVRGGSCWMLIDAGWKNDGPRIQAAVRSLLGEGSNPSAILLTHVHPDHSGSARALAQAWGCPVVVHRGELAIAMGDFAAMEQFAGPLDRWLILPAMRAIGESRRASTLAAGSLAGLVRPLEPGGAIPGLDGWEWIPTPGHTPGHVAYLRRRDGVVISGDALITLEVNAWAGLLRGLSAPPWYTTWDRRAATTSIARIAVLEPAVLAGGHGLPLTGPGTANAIHAFAAQADPGTMAKEATSMSDAPRLPPRWFIRVAWVGHRSIYRITGGRMGLHKATATNWGTMRLRSIGRRTGAERTAILGYFEDGPDLVTMAMNGWADPEPAWWLNLQAHPDTSVDLADGPRAVHARAADADERPRLWARWAVYDKGLDGYAGRRSRETAVVILEPRPAEPGAQDMS
jgi:deazaflavin-dependent oxidoreductase (nitroreductase family)